MPIRLLVAPLVTSCVLAVAAYGVSSAGPWGAGAGPVAGYEIRDIAYETPAADPAVVVAVSFTVTPEPGPAAVTQVRLQRGGDWFACRLDGAVATCATPRIGLDTVDQTAVTIDG